MMGIVDRIKQIDGAVVTVYKENRIFVDVDKDKVIGTLHSLKLMGFNQLSTASAIDRIKDGQFEIFYVLYNYMEKINAIVRMWIPRDNPVIETAGDIYPPVHTWEREMSEMFGVVVNGNEDAGKPFILENWKDLPPLRKDFDTVKYSSEHFVFRHSEGENE